jgi:1-deoxy-D-xylulose 5-phosphate reductoisomerase
MAGVVETAMDRLQDVVEATSLDDVFALDAEARRVAAQVCGARRP